MHGLEDPDRKAPGVKPSAKRTSPPITVEDLEPGEIATISLRVVCTSRHGKRGPVLIRPLFGDREGGVWSIPRNTVILSTDE